MASTNKTTNYELSQYVGTDKPTYLGDYNGDMYKIDAQMKLNADSASSAGTLASTASSTASTALENANTADTKATSAQTTATSALNKALKNESDIAKFNFTEFETFLSADMTTSRGNIRSNASVQVATNSDGSVGKIYGNIPVDNVNVGTGEFTVTIPNTKLRPESNISINGCGIRTLTRSDGIYDIYLASYSVSTTGTVEIVLTSDSATVTARCLLIGCVLFLTDFGDTPQAQN